VDDVQSGPIRVSWADGIANVSAQIEINSALSVFQKKKIQTPRIILAVLIPEEIDTCLV
jgi:hypothetical protein